MTDIAQKLVEKARTGKQKECEDMIKQQADVNFCEPPKGRTPIFRAVEGKRDDMVNFLMARGCEMNFVCQDPDEITELTCAHFAAFGGKPPLEHFLFFSGAWHNRWREKQRRLAAGESDDSSDDDDDDDDNDAEKRRKQLMKQLKKRLPYGNNDDDLKKRKKLWDKWDVNKDKKLSVSEAIDGLRKKLDLDSKGHKLDRNIIKCAYKHAVDGGDSDNEDDEGDGDDEGSQKGSEKSGEGGEDEDAEGRTTPAEGSTGSDGKSETSSQKSGGTSPSGSRQSSRESLQEEGGGSRRGSKGSNSSGSLGGGKKKKKKKSKKKKSGSQKVIRFIEFPHFRRFLYLMSLYFIFYELFKQMDADGTMKLDKKEFAGAAGLMKEIGIFIDDAEKEFDTIDADGSRRINLLEFCDFCWGNALDLPLDPPLEDDDDKDGDGGEKKKKKKRNVLDDLTPSEKWQKLLDSIPAGKGKDVRKAQDKLFDELDTGKGRGAGVLTYAELWGNFRKRFRGVPLPGCLNLSWPIKAAFRNTQMIDEGEDSLGRSSLSRREFRFFCEYLRLYMTLFRMFEQLDTSGEGILDESEFSTGWSQMTDWGFTMEGTPEDHFSKAASMAQGSNGISALEFFNWAMGQPLEISFEGDPEDEQEKKEEEEGADEPLALTPDLPIAPNTKEEEGETEGAEAPAEGTKEEKEGEGEAAEAGGAETGAAAAEGEAEAPPEASGEGGGGEGGGAAEEQPPS
uniref:EF-hand domain-containing protein n=1 Tax=Chromera velia CCMP2878 TaxID=1169474 RepID=A0A0G4FNK5_9ALVE|eukprot:Cvel_3535.t1-p1 / transcript=Cvel_3535.t1 / gene=Cvel_3535 / organism=Chromera_velia_CCMP2878 / gene_product=hypothetical protein / transcript_product=hypothetical protein / location=Cvel_scaffold144:24773-34344(-) / protein_length=732 / sequence_SO=supercontig / SO=protein_coding / is_pseudo=false